MRQEVTAGGRRQVTYAEDADRMLEIEELRQQAMMIKRRRVTRSEMLRWLTRLAMDVATIGAIERDL